MAATTYDPSFTNAGITLSGGNLTAARNAGGSFAITMATNRQSTGKYYWETVNGTISNNNFGLGASNTSQATNDFIGHTANSWGLFTAGNIWHNGINTPSGSLIPSLGGAGTRNEWAWDIGGNLLWVRVHGGQWNANVVNNPAIGVGGFSISGIAGGSYAPAFTTDTNGDGVTAVFSAASWVGTAPSGFGSFDGSLGGLFLTNRGMQNTGMDRGSGSIRG